MLVVSSLDLSLLSVLELPLLLSVRLVSSRVNAPRPCMPRNMVRYV